MQNSRSAEIARLNNELRTSLGKKGGKVVMTTSIQDCIAQLIEVFILIYPYGEEVILAIFRKRILRFIAKI